MNAQTDIDTPLDLALAEQLYARRIASQAGPER